MNKVEIIKILKSNDSTVLSFPERGPWGDSKYRGNCSGFVQAFLMWKYNVKKFAELFAGSGTGYDVARDMGISYVGADLNPNPVRPGILVCNAVTDEVPEAFYGADMVFMHPPYGKEIHIPYAGSMYKDPTGELSKSDLGQMPWDDFMKELNSIVMKYYAAMDKGSRMSILMGDVRRNGLHSMLNDIVKPGELEQIIIKMQHNTVSGRSGNSYGGFKKFVPLVHEYILVLKKNGTFQIVYQFPKKVSSDIRDAKSSTWRDVVYAALKGQGKMSLDEIYSQVENHEKAKHNEHWKEKIRQTLQMSNLFKSVERGVWSLNIA